MILPAEDQLHPMTATGLHGYQQLLSKLLMWEMSCAW